ncbi:MAG TPA: divalent metal cation transporter, partial [Sediminibacterium sp.]|nr:divalent metal cation transporter [Sediminibacterium sp.]
RWGIRKMEAFIIALVAIIGMSFLVQILIAQPAMGEVVGGLVPGFLNNGALYIAVGIIGATVMPHNLYLHSALVQTRKISPDKKGIKTAIKYNLIDSTVALNAAFLVNTAILVLAATVFYKTGNTEVAKIQDAHHLLEPLLGSALAPILFAVALIAAGQSSTITGTMAGQIVMEGYLHLRINPWLRRLLTRLIAIVPAVLVIVIYGDEKVDDLLIFSQVILSLQLGFAVIPLIHFVSDKTTMGDFAIGNKTKILSWLVAIILVFLNVNLVADETIALFHTDISWIAKAGIILVILLFIWLFVTMTFYPLLNKKKKQLADMLYGEAVLLENLAINKVQKIAVALDFTKADEKLIAHALAQGNTEVEYQLIHIVESVSARYSNYSSDDAETRKDTERLNSYVSQLIQKGYKATAMLGYTHRVKEIVRLVNESNAEMLIMGAHRHSGIKDYVFGETIEDVRHQLTIPVLIVNVSEKAIPQ